MPKEIIITQKATLFDGWQELPISYRGLVEAARSASKAAYAPHSHFCVGAAILLTDGSILKANNQENSSYPCGACAEQSLLYYYGAQTSLPPIRAMAITAYYHQQIKGVSPCGKCRQVMMESQLRQHQAFDILLEAGNDRFLLFQRVEDLLPMPFGPDAFSKAHNPMKP